MAMVVNHNVPALTTYNNVNRTNSALEKSIQKLSTGLRINSAADDAAGLAISEKMRAQINGMDRAVSNAQDGISMIQTAEGALSETHSILQRMRELSVQAANDTLTSQDRGYIQLEIDELRDEVTRIGNTTQFNKKKLLNGDAAVLWSSDDLDTKAIINGGLRSVDQFGQKVVTEGNYKITIKAEPGQGEVQKSDLFKIKHENVVINKSLNSDAGITDLKVKNVPAGTYKVTGLDDATNTVDNAVGGIYGIDSRVSTSGATSAKTIIEINAMTAKDLKVDGSSATAADRANIGKHFTISDGTSNIVDVELKDGMNGKDLLVEIQKQLKDASPKNYKINMGQDSTGKFYFETYTSEGDAPTITVDNAGTGVVLTAKTAAEKKVTKLADAITMTHDEATLVGNASVLFEVTDVNLQSKSVTLKATANIVNQDGSTKSVVQNDIVLSETATDPTNIEILGMDGSTAALTLKLNADFSKNFSAGDKFVLNFGKETDSEVKVQVSGIQNPDSPSSWGVSTSANPINYGFKAAPAQNTDLHLQAYYLNEKTGEANLGDIILSTNNDFNATNVADNTVTVAGFDATYVGQVAGGDTKLRDLDKFWTSEGVFMLDDPKTLTVTQGDGKQASVTLYATDTLNDVADKLNDAIATGLGQAALVNDASNFVNFVEHAASPTAESVPGTFVIRSVIPGASGAISFSGDENIINAFSLNTIQEAQESRYTVGVKDAHTGEIIADGVEISGNRLLGVVNPNVDVEFNAMAGVKGSWDETNKTFRYDAEEYSTVLHLSDNTTVFQIGANEGEDMGIHIGDMRANALGIDKVNVTTREGASRSITILDNAIDKVSTQRAKLGAYQNRLEHTINNLNTASENITAAESRIRDTDMAKEMMNFTKLQIMLQAGTSMLAQANQLPQNVMALVR